LENKGQGKRKDKRQKDRARTMFHKIMGNLEKNAGNRGHNIIFFPPIILIVAQKRAQKSDWGKIYDIFPPVSLFFPH
jgi:hypothetical protein